MFPSGCKQNNLYCWGICAGLAQELLGKSELSFLLLCHCRRMVVLRGSCPADTWSPTEGLLPCQWRGHSSPACLRPQSRSTWCLPNVILKAFTPVRSRSGRPCLMEIDFMKVELIGEIINNRTTSLEHLRCMEICKPLRSSQAPTCLSLVVSPSNISQ